LSDSIQHCLLDQILVYEFPFERLTLVDVPIGEGSKSDKTKEDKSEQKENWKDLRDKGDSDEEEWNRSTFLRNGLVSSKSW
jgi:hypothetical protein